MHFHRGKSARACETAHPHPVKNGWSWRYIVILPLTFMECTGTTLPSQAMIPITYCRRKIEMKSKQNFHAKMLHYFVKIRLFYFEKIKKSIVANNQIGGTRWSSWLMHCATSRKIASSISDGVTRIFHWHNPSGRTIALRSIQTLIEISIRNINFG